MADVATETRETSAAAAARRRRRASRAAGPVGEPTTAAVVTGSSPAAPAKPVLRGPDRPPRRLAHWRMVTLVAAVVAVVLTGVLAGVVGVLAVQHREADAVAARQQRFIDTASQMVVNMFSYRQSSLDDSVNRWLKDLSGPLRDQFSQPGTVDALKGLLHDTNADSEAVINAAALESIDEQANRASVLVAARVTATNIDDGVNKPTQPYRLRVVVQEDSTGAMTAYDLFWPNGGA